MDNRYQNGSSWSNGSGYVDPTYYEAMHNADRPETRQKTQRCDYSKKGLTDEEQEIIRKMTFDVKMVVANATNMATVKEITWIINGKTVWTDGYEIRERSR